MFINTYLYLSLFYTLTIQTPQYPMYGLPWVDDSNLYYTPAKAGTKTNPALDGATCVPKNGLCTKSIDCCTRSVCYQGSCNDGPNQRQDDHSSQIAAELSTGSNVDVSDHRNVALIPGLEECGRSWLNKRAPHSRQKRIVGGTPYDDGKYPWLVALHLNFISNGKLVDAFHCGGTLISKRYVVTAAHCATRIPTGLMMRYATFGNVDRRAKINCERDPRQPICTSGQFLDVEIEDVIIHEGFSDANARNDIALLRLKYDVTYTDRIQPICLPLSENIFTKWHDGKLTVAGWGTQNTLNDRGPPNFSFVAQELDMALVPRSSCDRFFTRVIGKLRKSQICAVGPAGKADCAGDSGGPLFKKVDALGNGDERYYLFGIVSTGDDSICGRQAKPSVFTHVIDFMPWLLGHLAPSKIGVGGSVSRLAVNPVEEFATGFNMDVRNHKNVALLPTQQCGSIQDQQDHTGPAFVKSRVKRVVGGIVQSVGTFPWMAQIYMKHVATVKPEFRCGGALITSRHVLTAAHCVGDLKGQYALDGVLLGNFNRKERTECIGPMCMDQVIVPIEDVYIHDGFQKYAREHDVALIKLGQTIPFSRFIRPICLPLSEDIIPLAWPEPQIDRRYVAAGWGRVTAHDDPSEPDFSNILVAANLTLENKKYCEWALVRRAGQMENTRVCGGDSIPGRGECLGDDGGPMMRWVMQNGPLDQKITRMYAMGVLSRSECAHQGVPSLYQNVLYHMPWIMDHLSF